MPYTNVLQRSNEKEMVLFNQLDGSSDYNGELVSIALLVLERIFGPAILWSI